MAIVEQSTVQRSRGSLRVAIVGCGTIAQLRYLPALKVLADSLTVVAVHDPDGRAQRWMAAECGAEELADYRAVLDVPALDAVLVLTPPVVRPEIVEAMLEGGLHVLAEKPLALSSRQARGLAETAARRDRRLAVAHTRRCEPAFEQLCTLVADATLSSCAVRTFENRWQAIASLALPARDFDDEVEFYAGVSDIEARLLGAVIGTEDPLVLRYYRWVILEALVHDLDLLSRVLGRPEQVLSAAIRRDVVALNLLVRYAHVDAALQWTLTDRLGTYEQVFEFTAAQSRIELRYPSPFLRGASAELLQHLPGAAASGEVVQASVPSREDAFVRLLTNFASAIRQPHCELTADGFAAAEALEDCEQVGNILAKTA